MAFAAAQWLMRGRADSAGPAPAPGAAAGLAPGFGAGLTSTLAHAAGPIVQMYLLPQRLPKLAFAATQAAFFWMLNLVKLAPFAAFGRLEPPQLRLAACMLPLIPAGVGLGYALVRLTGQRHYVALIRAVLAVTSGALVVKALWG
jgi:uncharacterized membrane protein YfcA